MPSADPRFPAGFLLVIRLRSFRLAAEAERGRAGAAPRYHDRWHGTPNPYLSLGRRGDP